MNAFCLACCLLTCCDEPPPLQEVAPPALMGGCDAGCGCGCNLGLPCSCARKAQESKNLDSCASCATSMVSVLSIPLPEVVPPLPVSGDVKTVAVLGVKDAIPQTVRAQFTVSNGQCAGGVCVVPSGVAQTGTNYFVPTASSCVEWRTRASDPTRRYLFVNGIQAGGYCTESKRFRYYDDTGGYALSWGEPLFRPPSWAPPLTAGNALQSFQISAGQAMSYQGMSAAGGSVCGPNGCGPAQGTARRGILGRRR